MTEKIETKSEETIKKEEPKKEPVDQIVEIQSRLPGKRSTTRLQPE
jgi:hypothetical protein